MARTLVLALVCLSARAQTPPAVQQLLDAPYATHEERKDLRVRFGLWTDDDLDTPARRAKAALTRGDLADPSLKDAAADPLDRAQAMVLRGEATPAIELLSSSRDASKTIRGQRLLAEAFLLAGKRDESKRTLDALGDAVGKSPPTNADELTDAVLAANFRAQHFGQAAASDFHTMMNLLGRAHNELDRLCWRAMLAEAQILSERSNLEDAEKSVEEALKLNPRLAEGMLLVGRLHADYFNFEEARKLGEALDKLTPGSAYGAAVLASIELKEGNAAEGLALIDAALKVNPGLPLLRSIRAASLARSYNFDACDKELAEIDATWPGTAMGYVEVGHMMCDARQYDEAIKYLNEATKREPFWAGPVVELGLIDVQAGRDAEAQDVLTKAVELDPFNVRADNSLRLVRELRTYTTVESDHFIIRYKPGVDEILAKEMLGPMEENYARVTGNERGGIDFKPAHKTVIELMPDHRWFAVRITAMPAVHTIAAATGPLIAMEAPRTGPNHKVGPYDWSRVLRHEFTHTVTLGRTKNRLPHWFTEAAAQYLEDAPRDFRAWETMAQAYDNDKIFDLDEINTGFTRNETRGQAYAQGHLMYEWIVNTWGSKAPLELMDLYATGMSETEAFRKVMNVSRAEFLERFKAWLGDQLIAVGMRPKKDMPALAELMKDVEENAKKPKVDPKQVDEWLAKYPEHPEVLELAVRAALKEHDGHATVDDVALLERFAKARPVDPLPHKTLASFLLSDAGKSAGGAQAAVAHLEWLDAREQYTPAFAAELAKYYAGAGELDKAWAKALRAVRIAPYEAERREAAAAIAIRRKDFASARWQLEALVKLEPDREIHKKRLEALSKLETASPGAK